MQKTDCEIAQTILEAIDQKAPVTINWNFEKEWLSAIIAGLKKAKEE